MAYDANGNLTKDLDRDIVTIRYNLLNLPEIVQFKNGHQIRNLYDASGRKLSTRNYTVFHYIQPIITTGSIYDLNDMAQNNEEVCIDFIDNIDNVEYTHFESYYEGDHYNHYDTYDISRIYNSEGYVNSFYSHHYFRRDHLGNNREVWQAPYRIGSTNYSASTVQRTQYYPSGLPWASNSSDNPSLQSRKYNGKEFVEMHGYDTYDIVWRQYYPAIGRFQSIDPEIEQAYNESPYAMCDNNMVNRTDPDGRFWNYVIGGAIGAGVDYASQVAVNLVEGKGIKESLTQVDGKSIMVSAVAGATGVGLASLTQKATTVYKLGSASSKVVNASTSVLSDAAISAGSQYAKDGKVSATNVVVDVVAGQAGRGAGNAAKANAQSSQTGVSYQKQANRATGKAMHNPNAAKSSRAEAANAKADNYGSKNETAVSSATSNTISSINENSKKIK